jgi:hypothetical protein
MTDKPYLHKEYRNIKDKGYSVDYVNENYLPPKWCKIKLVDYCWSLINGHVNRKKFCKDCDMRKGDKNED